MKFIAFAFSILIGFFICNGAQAEIFFEPVAAVGAGKYNEQSYTEARIGGLFSFSDQFLRGEVIGFYRFVDGADDFSGVDLGLHVQRWFQITNKFLMGTRIGPGYRWVSNDFDAPFLDFSLSFKHLDYFSFRLGYKLLFHELSDDDNDNESMLYVSFEI